MNIYSNILMQNKLPLLLLQKIKQNNKIKIEKFTIRDFQTSIRYILNISYSSLKINIDLLIFNCYIS